MQLFVATANRGKQAEFKNLLSELPIKLVFPQDLAVKVEFPEETGMTYAENAAIKARSLAAQTKLPCLADDSGLSVVSLGHFPGVRSARWLAGSDEDRVAGLLEKLSGFSDRSAYFSCVLCLYLPATNQQFYFEGKLEGTLAFQPTGKAGFGYDPIFIPNGYSSTIAQLGAPTKNTISHRAKAIEKFRVFIIDKYATLVDQAYETN